jgi:hypothetical protein
VATPGLPRAEQRELRPQDTWLRELRRQISASGSQNAKVILDTSGATNANQSLRGQHVNDLVQDTNSADAGASRSSKRVYRRRKNGPAT